MTIYLIFEYCGEPEFIEAHASLAEARLRVLRGPRRMDGSPWWVVGQFESSSAAIARSVQT